MFVDSAQLRTAFVAIFIAVCASSGLGGSLERKTALADRFLAAHPNTPMSQHVRSIADRIRADRAHP